MGVKLRQFSSLYKVGFAKDLNIPELNEITALGGEKFSYQVAVFDEGGNLETRNFIRAEAEGALAPFVKIYSVKSIETDFPLNERADDNYIAKTPCLIPDLLVPMEEQGGFANYINQLAVFWIEVSVPENFKAGSEELSIKFTGSRINNERTGWDENFSLKASLNVAVVGKNIPKQKTIFTQWFHTDCIASIHCVDIYSEKHWSLIDKYMKMAADLGINMILTPVIIPPLDTAPGTCRPNVQLVKIKKSGEQYTFDFALLKRYIDLSKKNGIKYFEISHFFAQWGCRFTPNIYVEENGEEKLLFGWHMKASDIEYAKFLKSFIPKLLEFFEKEGIREKCYFHLSDEPSDAHLEHYEYASNLLKPLLGDCKIIDALSHLDFYERGLVEHPICATSSIEPFLEKKVEGLWAYYCCAEVIDVSNRLLAMDSYRNRIIGLQLYKYGIEGFLQWGFNFYYSQYSLYTINPFVTTSSDGVFSSGDPFSVYPGRDCPLPSLRAFVFRDALQDIEICRLLEEKIGKEKVIELIEKEAGMELTFKKYPKDAEFIPYLMEKMKKMIKGEN